MFLRILFFYEVKSIVNQMLTRHTEKQKTSGWKSSIMKNLIIFVAFIRGIYCLKSMIWINKQSKVCTTYELKSFDQILKTLNSSEIRNDIVNNYYEVEHHNFNKQKIRLLFHEEPGVITSHAGNERITGYLGEIWTYLSEYANFRLKLLNAAEKRIGIRLTKNSSYNGLLRYVELEETDIVASISMGPGWNDLVDFCLPIYKDRVRIFTKVVYRENKFWMMHLVSWKAWLVVAIVQILFCLASKINSRYTSQGPKENEKIPANNIIDIFFYYIALTIQRSHHLFIYNKKGRILNFFVCMQSLLLLTYNNARLLSVMMQKTEYVPYQNLKDLQQNTKYIVLAEKDSLVHLSYEYLQSYQNYMHDLRYVMEGKRIKFIRNREQMFQLACTSKIPYAVMESEFFKTNVVQYGCNIKAYGRSYYSTFVTGGLKKNFMYKRTIDLGVLKLFEKGILTAQKNRLFGLKKDYNRNKFYKPINMEKISGMILIYFFGVLLSVIILLLENLSIYCIKNKG